MHCAQCGGINPEGPDVRFCRACGAALPPTSASATAVPTSDDVFAPAQPTPPTDGANGQAPRAAPLALAAPLAQVVPVAPVLQPVPAPGVVHIAVSPYGGFWIRLVAWLIDQVILLGTDLIALFALGFARALVLSLADVEYNSDFPSAVVWVAIFAVAIPYWLLFPPLLGATPGKLILGYHVVDENARHIGVKRSLGRLLAQIPSSIVLGLGYVWIGFDSRKQGWHDQIARTFVVRKELVKTS